MTDYKLVPVDGGPNLSDSTLPDEMIHAGAEAIERTQHDLANYVSGVTIDWDSGMIAVAVYRAMLSAAAAPVVGEPVAPKACNVCNGFVPTFSVPRLCSCRHHAPAGTHEMRDPKLDVAVKALEEARDWHERTRKSISKQPNTATKHWDMGQHEQQSYALDQALAQIKGGA